MATTFTWNINQLERETSDGYVFTAHYTVDAKDEAYSAGAYGSVGFERPEGDLIPFADLTAEVVIGWVKEKLGGDEKVAEIEKALTDRLAEVISPSKINGVPW